MRGVCWWALLVVAFWLGGVRTALGAERTLYWRELDVTARLDADGRLHIAERQVMVFTGDWNGGERRFRLDGDQTIELEGVTRIGSDGQRIPLRPGNLSAPDEYSWSDAQTLRWRSRRPSDPLFDHTEVTYVLSYALSNVLVPEGGTAYRLSHDFAFTDRPGNIERLTLDLELDPAWHTETPVSRHLGAGPLAPGQGVVVTLPLSYVGSGKPAGVPSSGDPVVRFVAAAALLGLCAWFLVGLFRREAALGRFAPLVPTRSIDEAWLDRHVFCLQPEVVGAAYDQRTGAAEVAAVIARMVLEKKLASRVTQRKGWFSSVDNLELSLLVERHTLTGYELALVQKLFFSGDQTDWASIREHYRRSGFDPAGTLRVPLQRRVQALLGIRQGPFLQSLLPLLPLACAGVLSIVGLVLMTKSRRSDVPLAIVGFLGGMLLGLTSGFLAHRWRSSLLKPALASLAFLAPLGLGILALAILILERGSLSSLGAVSFALYGITWGAIVTRVARSEGEASGLALRQRLAAARCYFAEELAKPEPRMQDAWFPYLVALDLGRHIDHWFRAFAGMSRSIPHSMGSGSSSSGRGWTGGGGAFGGAGASGSWVAATSTLAAGMSSQSSSSSSGGGGSSSSGGGGGGGW